MTNVININSAKTPDLQTAIEEFTGPAVNEAMRLPVPPPSIKIAFSQIVIDRISDNQFRIAFHDALGAMLTAKDWDIAVGEVLTFTDIGGSLKLNLVPN